MTVRVSGGYVHRQGMHCESACQRNIVSAHGLSVDEDVLFGLDGGFGFRYFASAGSEPDIVLGKQSILPLQAARLMGVEVTAHAPRSAAGLARLLGQAPAVLTRVDLGLLPYWGLDGRSAFGGYFVNTVGYDEAAGEVTLSDPAFAEPVTVSSGELAAARSSRLSPPVNPEYRCYVFGAPRRGLLLEKVGPVAVRNLCREVLRPNLRNTGIPGMKQLASAAARWDIDKQGPATDIDLDGNVVEMDACSHQLRYLGRQIETFGTGGGLFRPMLSRFLGKVAEATAEERYAEAAADFGESGNIWRALGQALLSGGGELDARARKERIDHVVESVRAVSRLENRSLRSVMSL